MPGAKFKLTVNWSHRSYVTYPIPAATYEDAFNFFQTKKARKEDWAKFDSSFGLVLEMNRGDQEFEIKINVGYTIAMPSWSKVGSSGRKGKAAWDAMILKLKKHEDGHADVFEEQVDKFGDMVLAETHLSPAKLRELQKAFLANLEKAQKGYDSKTAYGEKEGVVLLPPAKVKD